MFIFIVQSNQANFLLFLRFRLSPRHVIFTLPEHNLVRGNWLSLCKFLVHLRMQLVVIPLARFSIPCAIHVLNCIPLHHFELIHQNQSTEHCSALGIAWGRSDFRVINLKFCTLNQQNIIDDVIYLAYSKFLLFATFWGSIYCRYAHTFW